MNDCLSEINNTKVDIEDIEVVMSVYDIIEYTDSYSKTPGTLWQYYRGESTLTDDAGVIDDYPGISSSFKFKQKITGQTGNDGKKDVEIIVLLKYLSNF